MSKTREEMAEEAIRWVKTFPSAFERCNQCACEGYSAGYQAAQQWISVKDKLPEKGMEVLFHSPEKEMNCCFVGYRAAENEYVDPEGNGLIARQIEKYYTHWMPLPEAPKEEK